MAPPKKKDKTTASASKKRKVAKSSDDSERGKRQRRESKGYEPEDFTMASERKATSAKEVPQGRGFKLGDIPVIKASIEKLPSSHEDLTFAHNFIFGSRGKVTKKEMKEKLLEFNGYLPALPKGKFDDDKMDKEEDKHEAKFATRAYKMNLTQIRKLCHFFHIDPMGEENKPLNKDDTIDKLLDFLGEPDVGLTVEDPSKESKKVSKTTSKKETKKPSKKAIKAKSTPAKKKPVGDPFDAIKNHPKGEKPTDKALRQWAKAYVVCFDMDKATTKHAILTASDKFGVDLAPRKSKIKEMLADEM